MKDRYYIFVYSAALAFFVWDTLVKIVIEVKRRKQMKQNYLRAKALARNNNN